MLSLFKRKPKSAVEAEPNEELVELEIAEPAGAAEPVETVRRMKQQNIKASEDCCAAFAAIATALDMTKAQLFEDMVAERLEQLQRQGIQVEAV
jgi:hypothetical protein